ncbi:hypothetical protein [Absidia glauca]|uniref:Uncharacterized protein n=1 Tax=Absidia glauca TaxID=4829 RepID=A0A168RJ93_ABSGL|nr:hypothetical protein [Absidia glauca]
MNPSTRHAALFDQPPSLSRRRSSSPKQRPALQSRQSQPSLSRQTSDISLYDQSFSQLDATNPDTREPWTRKQWDSLEQWYDKMDRDYQRAATAFYIHDSVVSETGPPLWPKEYIMWRCQCLDTNTKYHHGVLPSERKRRKDLLKAKRKQDMKRQQQQQQQQQQLEQQKRKEEDLGYDRKYGNVTSKETERTGSIGRTGSDIGSSSNGVGSRNRDRIMNSSSDSGSGRGRNSATYPSFE